MNHTRGLPRSSSCKNRHLGTESACQVLLEVFARPFYEEIDMRATQYRHLASELQDRTTGLLLRHLRPKDYSRRCTALVLLSGLVLATARQLSLAAVAAVRRACPSRETLRQALYATLPAYDALRRRTPALLRASLPRGLTRHRVPYYKRGRTPPAHVRKGQRLPGTRYAHDYATASLLLKGQYYVVAVTPYDS